MSSASLGDLWSVATGRRPTAPGSLGPLVPTSSTPRKPIQDRFEPVATEWPNPHQRLGNLRIRARLALAALNPGLVGRAGRRRTTVGADPGRRRPTPATHRGIRQPAAELAPGRLLI